MPCYCGWDCLRPNLFAFRKRRHARRAAERQAGDQPLSSEIDLLIIGSGPAGMSAAIKAREYGMAVLVIDEQPEPGGQIWRAIERVGTSDRASILGTAYTDGLSIAERFRQCGAKFNPETTLWHLESGPVAFLKSNGAAKRITPRAVLLATGAQERPTPFKGWTLPGVLTVGAGQILLKSAAQIPEGPVWIAGSGPLSYLYAVQLVDAGARVSGFLDTRPKGRIVRNVRSLASAVMGQPANIIKGLQWLTKLKKHCRYISNVRNIAAHGDDLLEQISFQAGNRPPETVAAQHLLVHEGIVPAIHPTMALGCDHNWNDMQDSYAPAVDAWGETSEPSIFVAGDLAGIGGADAACLRGELAAIRIAQKHAKRNIVGAERDAAMINKRLSKALSSRPFLDKAYRPRPTAFIPDDDAIACRCEEVTVGQIRSLCKGGKGDPNRIKAFSRAGMGACQGRLCNYTVANILAEESDSTPSAIGLYRVRPPFKPLTMDELAKLQTDEGHP